VSAGAGFTTNATRPDDTPAAVPTETRCVPTVSKPCGTEVVSRFALIVVPPMLAPSQYAESPLKKFAPLICSGNVPVVHPAVALVLTVQLAGFRLTMPGRGTTVIE